MSKFEQMPMPEGEKSGEFPIKQKIEGRFMMPDDLSKKLHEMFGEYTIEDLEILPVMDEAHQFDAHGSITIADKEGKIQKFSLEHRREFGKEEWEWHVISWEEYLKKQEIIEKDIIK